MIKTLPQTPKVIFLDAFQTIFNLKVGVGQVYQHIAYQFNVETTAQVLEKNFAKNLKKFPALAFPGSDKKTIKQKEYQWWYDLVKKTFIDSQYYGQFTDFAAFFEQLYNYFLTLEPWFVYDDVIPALNYWHSCGISLGIISNFDSRLEKILLMLNLADYFETVTISSYSNAAKPQPEIFLAALAKHNCQPQEAWHIGDSLEADYYGAKQVGITPFLIKR